MSKIKKIVAMMLLSTAMVTVLPVSANAAWKQNNSGWWYTEGSSYATGWRNIDGNWYYFWPKSGYMAEQTTVDGYYLGQGGAWLDDSNFNVSANDAQEKAKNYLLNKYGYVPQYVECCSFDGSQWTIHCYSITTYDNGWPSHTATMAWLYVDKNTGTVTSMF